MVRRLIVVALALVLVAGAGCGTKSPSGPKPAEKPSGADKTRISRDTLPLSPGYVWQTARFLGPGTLPVDLTVAGPWKLPDPGADWPVTESETVEPSSVPDLSAFKGYDFVVHAVEGGADLYYPRQVTDQWMQQLGKITVTNGQANAEPYDKPLRLWPVGFTVGQTFVVSDEGSFKIDATVLAQNTATIASTDIPDAYLVRFDYKPLAEGAMEGSQYYILAPNVGYVALFSVASGDEQSGFKALDSLDVLVSLPHKQ